MKFKFKKIILLEILFIFILSLVPLLWFRPGQMMLGHDNVFPLAPERFLQGRLYTWINNQGFGKDQSVIMGTIPIHLIDAIPSFLGFSLLTGQKIIYIFWFFLIGFSVYLFASLINRQSSFFKLIVTLLYQFNFFILQGWFIGERTKFSAYIAMPLVLSIFLLVYRKKIVALKAGALVAFIFFFFNAGGLFGIPLYGGLFVAAGLFILYFSLIAFSRREKMVIKNLLLTAVFGMIGYLLLSAYFFLPALHMFFSEYGSRMKGSGGVAGLVYWAKMLSAEASPLNLFRLQGIADWYDNPQHSYSSFFLTSPYLIFLSFVWPLLTLLSLILVKRKPQVRFVLYFFLVYLIGIFFAAGPHPPLGFLYVFLMKIVPGFAVFRSPFYKFAPSILLANAFLCAFTLNFIKGKLKSLNFLSTVFGCLCVVLILGYHFPFFTGDFFNWRDNFSTRLKVPDYVFEFGRWINEEKQDDLRVLAAPPLNKAWEYELYDWGYLSFSPVPQLITTNPVILNDEWINDEQDKKMLEFVYSSLLEGDERIFQRMTDLLRIGYLLVRDDFYYDVDWAKTDNPADYHMAAEKFNSLTKEKEFDQWSVYKINNNQALPQVNGFTSIRLLSSRLDVFKNFYSIEKLLPPSSIFIQNFDLIRDAGLDLVQEHYFFPSCLSCQIEGESLFIIFPEVRFLPDSPFYFLTKFKEPLLENIPDPLVKTETAIELSLKRITEMKPMLKNALGSANDKITAIESYAFFINRLNESFESIPQGDSRLIMAEKLAAYLEAEHSELSEWYEDHYQFPLQEDVRKKLKEAMWVLLSLRNKVKEDLFNRDFITNKLYSFDVIKEGHYQVLVDKKSIGSNLVGEDILIQVDPSQPLISPVGSDDDWLDFGKHFLTVDHHWLLLTLPTPPRVLSDWRFTEKLLPAGLKSCYIADIENFSDKATYRLDLTYKNNLFPDLFYFSKKKELENEKGFFEATATVFLPPRSQIRKERFFIMPDISSPGVQIGFCAAEMTQVDFEKTINLQPRRISSPSVFLKSIQPHTQEIKDLLIDLRQVNSTKFYVHVDNAQSSFILTLAEKFSPEWQIYLKKGAESKTGQFLETFGEKPIFNQTHFLANGYANGWLINKTGTYDLIIEYLPQKVFYRGVILTASCFLAVLIILMRKRKQ